LVVQSRPGVNRIGFGTILDRVGPYRQNLLIRGANIVRLALIFLVLSMVTGEALAKVRIETTGMTCAEVQSSLQSAGVATLHYRSPRNPGLQLYDQYVASGAFCRVDDVVTVRMVATRDTASCPVRKCVSIHRSGRR
jgi:hypothetical protein